MCVIISPKPIKKKTYNFTSNLFILPFESNNLFMIDMTWSYYIKNDECDEFCTSNKIPLLAIKGLQFLAVLQVPKLLARSVEGKCVL